MTKDEKKRLFDESTAMYGLTRELAVLMEECGELTQAASKVLRAPERDNTQVREDRSHLAEEMADVRLMCDKVERALGIGGEAKAIYGSKLIRLQGRLEALRNQPEPGIWGLDDAIRHYGQMAKSADTASRQMLEWLTELRARRGGADGATLPLGATNE